MNRIKISLAIGIAVILVLSLVLTACASPTPTPSPTPGTTPTTQPSASPSPKPTASPTPAGSTAADFYKGKTVTWIVHDKAGSDDDLIARTTAPLLQKHLGASKVVVINKDQAGGIEAANELYTSAADGTVFGFLRRSSIITKSIFQEAAVKYDPVKFTYVGFSFPTKWVFFATLDSGPYPTLEKVKAGKGLRMMGAAPFENYTISLLAVASLLNIDGKVATGMKGSERAKALLDATLDASLYSPQYIDTFNQPGQKIVPLIAIRDKRFEAYPDCPALTELLPSDASQQTKDLIRFAYVSMMAGNTFGMPPGVPADRVAFFNDAFNKSIMEHFDEVVKYLGEPFTANDLVPPDQVTREVQQDIGASASIISTINQLWDKYKA